MTPLNQLSNHKKRKIRYYMIVLLPLLLIIISMISIWKLNINHTITSIQQHHDHLIITTPHHMKKPKTIQKRFSLNLPPNNNNNDNNNNNSNDYEFHIVFSTGCNAFQDCKFLLE